MNNFTLIYEIDTLKNNTFGILGFLLDYSEEFNLHY